MENKMDKVAYVDTLEISGFYSSFRAMRLPFKNLDKSDTDWGKFEIGEKDLKLMQNLIKAGDEHAKIMRGIVVWAELNLPRYIWSELDTYTVGVIPLCSESTMHVEAKGLSGEELVKFKENLTEGHLQKRIRAFSYQTLRRIYFQRRNHRLPIWREVICPWIETLPMTNELILYGFLHG